MRYLDNDAEDKTENVYPWWCCYARVIVQEIEIHQILLRDPQMKILVDVCVLDLSIYQSLQNYSRECHND